MIDVYIRRLQIGDHLTSYKWRNNPEIWKLTGSRPDVVVTEEIEEQWLEGVLAQMDSIRFAICITGTGEYIGNVQLTGIADSQAEFHIFIGETKHWGKGIAKQATMLMLEEGFRYGLNEIYLYVHKDNVSAINVYLKCGFLIEDDSTDNIRMSVLKKG
jgi:RimJ/RimL family protein N-acetyltransferase